VTQEPPEPDVARYLAREAERLAALAERAKLGTVAYLPRMAQFEAEQAMNVKGADRARE
jgi:hypothetical protein